MRKRSLILVAAVLTLVAAVSAVGVNRAIERFAGLPEGAEVADVEREEAEEAPVRQTVDRAPSKQQYVRGILERNIFDASAIGKPATVTDQVVTDLNVRLIGTLVAQPEVFSSALIADEGNGGVTRGYGIGDKLADAEVVKIERNTVTIRRGNGDLEVLTVGEGGEDRPAAAARPAPEPDEEISQVSDNSFVVDRGLVERYITDLDAIARMGRAIPHRGTDGEIDGYRLSGIRRHSLGEKLGIKNGDIVHSVNGNPLTSMQGAMQAYTSLQSEGDFEFEITRRGQRMTLEYEVR